MLAATGRAELGAAMGFKKYRGPVETVQHAMMAHLVVTVTCQQCGRWTSMWAWRIYQAKPGAYATPLRKPVSGFWCKGCQRSVEVVILPKMNQ